MGVQHGFYARPAAHLRSLATTAGFGTICGSSGIVRFVQGGVVKTFRCTPLVNPMTRRRQKRDIANGGLPPGAVAADTSKQVPINTYGSPKTFYVDVDFKCRDCGSKETWTAKDQKWFYEVAKGSLHQTAVRCRDCRNKLKAAKELQRQQMEAADEAKRDG